MKILTLPENDSAPAREKTSRRRARRWIALVLGVLALVCVVWPASAANPLDERIQQLEGRLGGGTRVFRFRQGLAAGDIGNMSMLATNFQAGVFNRGGNLLRLEVGDNAYLRELFGVDYDLVGRRMGNLLGPQAQSVIAMTADVRTKYALGAAVRLGPRFPGVGIEVESGEVFNMVEYLHGKQLSHYSGRTISRGMVEAFDRGIMTLAAGHDLLALDVHPNNLMVRSLVDHPQGYLYDVTGYDWHVLRMSSMSQGMEAAVAQGLPHDFPNPAALPHPMTTERFARLLVRNTLESRYYLMKGYEARGLTGEWITWPRFYEPVLAEAAHMDPMRVARFLRFPFKRN